MIWDGQNTLHMRKKLTGKPARRLHYPTYPFRHHLPASLNPERGNILTTTISSPLEKPWLRVAFASRNKADSGEQAAGNAGIDL